MVQKDKYEQMAVNLYRSSNMAILSTISKRYDGYPFGSFITFISGNNRDAYIYISNLAQHTKNIKNNPKACITIISNEDEDDKQNTSRLSIMGNMSKVTNDLECESRFKKFLPESDKYRLAHDFNFYRLSITNVRWIGGFGDIAWLNEKLWKTGDPKWKTSEDGIIKHMNEDHQKVIADALNAQHKINDKEAKMHLLCIDGYYVLSKNKIYFISFDQPCYNVKEYKAMLVKQAGAYKNI
ncbi:MAG TPA: hypothetical protein DCL68_06005 [Gammaproteobacteria bacterium]|nr:hypothetical protein [Gammaproteobacteria bacterium]|tara:strand:- start:12 stop:728 length:717 start_codon:yes stop_codon:yes gene_type:complete